MTLSCSSFNRISSSAFFVTARPAMSDFRRADTLAEDIHKQRFLQSTAQSTLVDTTQVDGFIPQPPVPTLHTVNGTTQAVTSSVDKHHTSG